MGLTVQFWQSRRPGEIDVALCFMLRYLLTEDDVGSVRFGISPLCELGLSIRAIADPSRFPLQVGWLRRTEAQRERLDRDVLLALIDDRGWTPDFLNPRPTSPLTRLDDEFAALLATPPEVFRGDLVAVHGRVPDVLQGSTGRALRRVSRRPNDEGSRHRADPSDLSTRCATKAHLQLVVCDGLW